MENNAHSNSSKLGDGGFIFKTFSYLDKFIPDPPLRTPAEHKQFLKEYRQKQRAEKLKKRKHGKKNRAKKMQKKVCDFIASMDGENKIIKGAKIYNRSQPSAGEKEVTRILSVFNVKFVAEMEFTDLVNPLTGQQLRFDFYLPEFNAIIEFDGKQHFQYHPDFHSKDGYGSFDAQKKRDRFKNQYCVKRGIKLLRIKYNQFSKMKDLIQTFLIKK